MSIIHSIEDVCETVRHRESFPRTATLSLCCAARRMVEILVGHLTPGFFLRPRSSLFITVASVMASLLALRSSSHFQHRRRVSLDSLSKLHSPISISSCLATLGTPSSTARGSPSRRSSPPNAKKKRTVSALFVRFFVVRLLGRRYHVRADRAALLRRGMPPAPAMQECSDRRLLRP